MILIPVLAKRFSNNVTTATTATTTTTTTTTITTTTTTTTTTTKQQQLQLQQQLIHTSTPIHPPKSSENFPEDFFKLSTLKVPAKSLKTDPKELIKQLTELEAKCSVWEKQWPKDKILNFKRVANTVINTISSHDVDSLLVKINILHSLLCGQITNVLNLSFRAESKDEIDYFSNLITAKLIKKGEQEVSSNPKYSSSHRLCSSMSLFKSCISRRTYISCVIQSVSIDRSYLPHTDTARFQRVSPINRV